MMQVFQCRGAKKLLKVVKQSLQMCIMLLYHTMKHNETYIEAEKYYIKLFDCFLANNFKTV